MNIPASAHIALSRQSAISPFLLEPAIVPGLGPDLDRVPDDLHEWLVWKHRVSALREEVRRSCEGDTREAAKNRAAEMRLCADDPAYFLIMYGVVFEPRKYRDRKPGWYRWMLFASQVKTIRAIQFAMNAEELGRGDLIVEKSREMGFSWIVCGYIAHQFLFSDHFVAGLISRNAEKVDRTGDTDTLFYKIRANLGIIEQVPDYLRLPKWMMPAGFNAEDHSLLRLITHPTKTNTIVGETTTEMAGVGGRATLRFSDEAARFDDFDQAWANQGGTSNHRIAGSSADTKSPGFKILADLGKECIANPQREGPTFLRLDWWYNPYHTQEWYENEKARFKTDPHYFAREYELDYYAGAGQSTYPRFSLIRPSNSPYDPYLGRLWCTIDPGLADPPAAVWIQEDRAAKRYRIVNSFMGRGGEDAEFLTSIVLGIPLSGLGYDYGSYPGLHDLMAWTGSLNRAVIYVGDPAGRNAGGASHKSFYDGMTTSSRDMSGGSSVINVRTITKIEKSGQGDARSFQNRRTAINKLTHRMDFDANPGGIMVLTALQETRYLQRKEGRTYQSELLEPAHDKWSHLRSAVEFWAVIITEDEQIREVTEDITAAPIRISMSGRTVA